MPSGQMCLSMIGGKLSGFIAFELLVILMALVTASSWNVKGNKLRFVCHVYKEHLRRKSRHCLTKECAC